MSARDSLPGSGSEAGLSESTKGEAEMHRVVPEPYLTPVRRSEGQLLILSWYSLYSGESFLGAFVKFRKVPLASSCLSVCSHGTAVLPLDAFV